MATLQKLFLLAVAVFGVGALRAAEPVDVQALPQPVQKTLEEAREGEPVKEVRRTESNGKVIYIAEIERNNAINPRLRIAEDGTLLGRSDNWPVTSSGEPAPVFPIAPGGVEPTGTEFTTRLQWDEVPAPVRRTIEQEARGREIVDLDREEWNDREVYEVEFSDPGFNEQIHVNADGSLAEDRPVGERLADWFKGTQVEDTPQPVQETIRREVDPRRIVDIDVERRTGEAVYEVEVRDPAGEFQLHIAADGRVVRDGRSQRAAE